MLLAIASALLSRESTYRVVPVLVLSNFYVCLNIFIVTFPSGSHLYGLPVEAFATRT